MGCQRETTFPPVCSPEVRVQEVLRSVPRWLEPFQRGAATRNTRSLRFLGRMQRVFQEFLLDGGPRDAEPAGGLALVAARQLQRLSIKLAFDDVGQRRADILNFTALCRGEQFCDLTCDGLLG